MDGDDQKPYFETTRLSPRYSTFDRRPNPDQLPPVVDTLAGKRGARAQQALITPIQTSAFAWMLRVCRSPFTCSSPAHWMS